VDFFECGVCAQRFIVADAGEGDGWLCPLDGIELKLVAWGLTGTAREMEQALNARLLAQPVLGREPDGCGTAQ
jgi:hypothetical protein